MDMIAMLAGLGQTTDAATAAQTKAEVQRTAEQAMAMGAEANKDFYKTLGWVALGAVAGWFARGSMDRRSY